MTAAEVMQRADKVGARVRPFLLSGDDWRPDADGVPPIEDVLRAWCRVMGERPTGSYPTPFEVNVYANEYEVGTPLTGEYCTGESVAEAALWLLESALDRTCVTCRVWDGHDRDCEEAS